MASQITDNLAAKIKDATREAAAAIEDLVAKYRQAAPFKEAFERLQADAEEQLRQAAAALQKRDAELEARDREIADLRAQRDAMQAKLQEALQRAQDAEDATRRLREREAEFAAHPIIRAERLAALKAEQDRAAAEARRRQEEMDAIAQALKETPP